eukprot:scaffold1590_cov417-Prasinococcus_capsulatus_cf.AAC.11
MSWSVTLLMCPFRTVLSQILSGLAPMLYRIERKPDWKVFLNILAICNVDVGLDAEDMFQWPERRYSPSRGHGVRNDAPCFKGLWPGSPQRQPGICSRG